MEVVALLTLLFSHVIINLIKVNAKITAHTDCGCVELVDKVIEVTLE